MVDCLTWSLECGVEVVASDMTRLPTWLRARYPLLNWDRIAEFVAVPTAATTNPLFDDVRAVGPGELLALGDGRGAADVIWSPVDFARELSRDPREAGRELVRRVDSCTADLVGSYDKILMELSGGLDSSILASALAVGGLTPRVVQWINITDPRPEADESRYARAVTDALGVDLTSVLRRPGELKEADLIELSDAFWPGIAGVDAVRDHDEVARIRATGAQAILSGQGGDGAFFQMGSALVVADALRREGPSALASPLLSNIARRTRQSVWGVLGEVWADHRGRLRQRKIINAFVTPEVRASAGALEHAWVQAARSTDLPPGKKLHIRALATNHFNHASSRRRREADLLFPLLAQPIIELCLSLATPDLAGGSYDRPFERSIFADRIPPIVLNRRTKGNLSVYFAKLMSNSVEMLRPYLLDGCLCRSGVLDRAKLERALDPSYLILSEAANDLVGAVAVESWVRHWQTRVPDSPLAPRPRL